MTENYSIICFAPNDWWGMNPSCATHYMLRFARERKVLFVNPFSSDMGGVKQGLLKRVKRKLKSLSKCLQNPVDNLYVYSPVFLPFHGNRWLDSLNNWFLKKQIQSVCKKINITDPIIWAENPRACDLIEYFDYRKMIYHVSDDFSKSRYIKNKEALEKREAELTRKSDLIIAVSQSLYESKKRGKNTRYLPHGVDFEIFHKASVSSEKLPETALLPKPIVGYYGTLTNSNDIEMWVYCAMKLSMYSFVFAGQVTGGDYSELSSLSNVHFLGKMSYDKIPLLCASFNVCMLQWKMTDWISACNPLKTMEYMASGKPIVSVPIKYIADNYKDIVSIAATKEEYCEAIQFELHNDTPERSARRVEIAREHSWNNNFQVIKQWIADLLSKDEKQEQ